MIGTTLAGKYFISTLIGSGGMAMVYKGQEIKTGKTVAIKVLKSEHMQDAQLVRRFEQETRIALTYSHKNIVKTYEVLNINGIHYIVMEFVEGYILSDYIAQKGKMEIREIIDIGKQVCNALFYAHSHRLIHRDIKPQNIMINQDGVVKVLDFGIAKTLTMPDTTVNSPEALGSVHYISPEQAQGNPVTEKTDIYSMGVVLYEMSTGRVPFDGKTPVEVALKQVREMPQPPSELRPALPKSLEKIILKAMSKDVAERYDNAREMSRDIERVLDDPDGHYVHMIKKPSAETTKMPKITREEEKSEQKSAPRASQKESEILSRNSISTSRVLKSRYRLPKGLLITIIVAGLLLLCMAVFFIVETIQQDKNTSMVSVPSLVDYPLDVAENYLANAGLVWDVQEVYSDTYDKGKVVSHFPEGTEIVPKGTTVVLYISSGPKEIEVPSLLELDEESATAKAAKAGLFVSEARFEDSDKIPGTVIRQEPLPGVRVPQDQGIIVYLAKAPENQQERSMPRLLGLNKDIAVDQLVDMNVQVELLVRHIESDYAKDTIAQQEPAEGTPITEDTKVTLWISSGHEALYQMEKSIQVKVKAPDTKVTVTFIDVDHESVVYDAVMQSGEQTVILELSSDTEGSKQLVVYFDDLECERIDFILTGQ